MLKTGTHGARGGIQPWIYSLLALHREGYTITHPVMARGLAALRAHWSYQREGGLHIQASESPVWDTALALLAMQDCDRSHENSRTMSDAVEWLLDQQILVRGDWKVRVRNAKPGGWAFERANIHYPDIDDTAVVLIVLARLRPHYRDRERLEQAIIAGRDWMLAMQSTTAAGRRSTRTTIGGALGCRSATSAGRWIRRARTSRRTCSKRSAGSTSIARLGAGAGSRICAASRARRKLVRPLGRELHLRRRRCATLAAIGEQSAPYVRRAAAGLSRTRTTTAAGAKPALRTWTILCAAKARARPHRPVGR